MLSILGTGSAYPETKLDNDLLSQLLQDTELSDQIVRTCGIESRSSVLPKEYVLETCNRNPRKAPELAQSTPTSLAVRACDIALERAGLVRKDVGLILGATSTPYQTTPSEAQRVGKALEMKVPAYDLFCGAADFALCCHTIGNWKKDRLPEYILFVTTNCPTLKANYEEMGAAHLFGDAAFAAVLSVKKQGSLGVTASGYFCDSSITKEFSFPLYGHARVGEKEIFEWVSSCLKHLSQQFSSLCPGISPSDCLAVGSQVGTLLDSELLGSAGFQLLPGIAKDHGYSVGSASPLVLAEQWEQLTTQEQPIALFMAGAGSSSGLVVLESLAGG